MEDKKENGTNKEPEKIPAVTIIPPEDNSKDGIKEAEQSPDINKENNSDNKCPKPVIVKEEGKEGWKRTEIISAVSACLSFIAICITSYSVSKTVESVAISAKALQNSERKDSVAAIKDSLKSITDSIKDVINYKKDTSAFGMNKRDIEERSKREYASLELTKQSIKAQLSSLEETQRQFNLVNQPFLQITDLKLVPLVAGKTFDITYNLVNLSNIPVKVISQKTTIAIDYKNPPIEEINKYADTNKVGLYLIKDGSVTGKISDFQPPMSPLEVDLINNKGHYLFVSRKIKYQNLVTKRIREYFIYFKIRPIKGNTIYPNETYFDFIVNENYDN